ncbi:MAG: hypothetical protein MI808_23140 [Pseudomonadales bacterium]|nr:hypothetical protein [Pseudomonadales bacterium]
MGWQRSLGWVMLFCGVFAVQLTGCKNSGPIEMKMDSNPVRSQAGRAFYHNGFPTDLRQSEEGVVDISDFPRQYHLLTAELVVAIEHYIRGFHTVSTVYLPFSGPLPDAFLNKEPLEYAHKASFVQVVDIDPSSPEYGRRFPLDVSQTLKRDEYRPAFLLQIQPVLGVNLRPNTTYGAFVIKPGFELGVFRQNPMLRQRLENEYKLLNAFLLGQSMDVDSVIGATVFTTGAPSQKLHQGAQVAMDLALQVGESSVNNLAYLKSYDEYCVVRGDISIPMFQRGIAPYYLWGGLIEWNQHQPTVQRWRDTEFVLTIPKASAGGQSMMPEGGFPLLAYVHGAGGRAHQVYDRGPFDRIDFTQYPHYLGEEGKGPSLIAAQRGWASSGLAGHLSYDHLGQLASFRGAVVYNLFNPVGLMGSYYQMAWERIYFRHVVNQLQLPGDICPDAQFDSDIVFDAALQVSMGQSHGSWVNSLVTAADPLPYKGAIFSGVSGTWAKLYNNNPSYRMAMDAIVINRLPSGRLDDAHPFLMLTEWLLGPVDSVANVDSLLRYPQKTPPHVMGFSGYNDYYSTEETQRPFFMALGADLVGEDIGEGEGETFIPYISAAGLQQLDYPQWGNRLSPGYGERTAAVMRYRGNNPFFWETGHEITFQLEEIKHQYGCFLQQLAQGGTPVVDKGVSIGGGCFGEE